MKKEIFYKFIITCILSTRFVVAQDSLSSVKYQVEVGAFGSTNEILPFWLRSNQYGEVPMNSNYVTVRGQIEKGYTNNKKFDVGYKVRAVANQGLEENKFMFSEAFLKVKYKQFEIYAGRRKEIFGLTDSTLSSGSYIWSGNSLGVPKIQISTNGYVPLLKSKTLFVNASYSHGVFGSTESVKHYFLHQKSLYFKIGQPSWKIKVYGGINHQVQWGGRPAVPFVSPYTKELITNYPTAYGYIISGLPPKNKELIIDGGGRVGNSLGTIDIGVDVDLNSSKLLLYKQSIYEKGDFTTLNNISDGIYGLSIHFNNVKSGIVRLNFEILNTMSQGGDVESKFTGTKALKGQMDYFNNITYIDGWVYKGNTIGTPFLFTGNQSPYISDKTTNKNILNTIANNRVRAYILSLDTKLNKVNLRSRISLSENYGTYKNSISSITQISLQQSIIYPLKQNYTLNINLGYDNQGIFNQSLGGGFILQKTF